MAPAPEPLAEVTPPVPSGRTWTVKGGDHFWSIAERTVSAAHPDPTERQVAEYWLRLIDANAERLADPRNPDMLRIGVVLDLPAIPGVR